MTAVSYNQWLPATQAHLTNCPTDMILEAIRTTCIMFCASTRYLRVELDPFNTVATNDEYNLSPPVDSAIAEILSLRINGRQLMPTTVNALEAETADWKLRSGTPTRYFQRGKATVVVNPVPANVYQVRAVVVVKPTQSSGGVDERIFEEWKPAITSGVLAYLMAMPEKEWSNPNLSAYHGTLYSAAVVDARNQADSGYSLTRPSRVRARFL